MPSLRQTSATVTPLSACCNANTICDSVNLDFFMAIVRLPSCHKLPAFLYFILAVFFGRRSHRSNVRRDTSVSAQCEKYEAPLWSVREFELSGLRHEPKASAAPYPTRSF